jgi:hypothetical protein
MGTTQNEPIGRLPREPKFKGRTKVTMDAESHPQNGPRGRGIFWILAALVVTGIVAGYSWLKGLPKETRPPR